MKLLPKFFRKKPINHFEPNYSLLVSEVQTKLDYVTKFGIFFKNKRIKKKLLGLKGEYLVNKELESLNDSFYVYYDISISFDKKSAQIDHIVIGKTGKGFKKHKKRILKKLEDVCKQYENVLVVLSNSDYRTHYSRLLKGLNVEIITRNEIKNLMKSKAQKKKKK
jgi:hypothetical protein